MRDGFDWWRIGKYHSAKPSRADKGYQRHQFGCISTCKSIENITKFVVFLPQLTLDWIESYHDPCQRPHSILELLPAKNRYIPIPTRRTPKIFLLILTSPRSFHRNGAPFHRGNPLGRVQPLLLGLSFFQHVLNNHFFVFIMRHPLS